MGNLCGTSNKKVVQEPAAEQTKQNIQTQSVEKPKEPTVVATEESTEPKIEKIEPKVEPIVDEPIAPAHEQNDGLTEEQRKEMEEEQKRLEEEARLFEQEEKLAEEERLKVEKVSPLEMPLETSVTPQDIESMTPRTASGILSRRASFKMRYELAKQLEEKIEEEEKNPTDNRRASVIITEEVAQLNKMDEEEEEERRQLEERRRKRAQLFFRSQSISSSPRLEENGTEPPPPPPPQKEIPESKPIEKRAKSEIAQKKPKALEHTHSMQSSSGVTLGDIEEKRTHLKSSQRRETEEDVWKNVFK